MRQVFSNAFRERKKHRIIWQAVKNERKVPCENCQGIKDAAVLVAGHFDKRMGASVF